MEKRNDGYPPRKRKKWLKRGNIPDERTNRTSSQFWNDKQCAQCLLGILFVYFLQQLIRFHLFLSKFLFYSVNPSFTLDVISWLEIFFFLSCPLNFLYGGGPALVHCGWDPRRPITTSHSILLYICISLLWHINREWKRHFLALRRIDLNFFVENR
jgi:hypothetical protein